MSDTAKSKASGFALVAVGFGPLLSFIAAYFFVPAPEPRRILVATAIFMAATIAAAIAWRIRGTARPPFSWLSTALLMVMGGLTLWLQDEVFIKVLPTVQGGLAAALAVSVLLTGYPRPEFLLKEDRINMDMAGWRRLFGYGAGVAILLALLNEAVWRNASTGFWITFQLWGRLGVVVLCAVLAMPLLRNAGVSCNVPAAGASNPGE